MSEHSKETFFLESVFAGAEIADCRPVTLDEKGQFCKDFLGIFKLLEQSFLSEHFQKIICSGIFASIVRCTLYLSICI